MWDWERKHFYLKGAGVIIGLPEVALGVAITADWMGISIFFCKGVTYAWFKW